jgi:hypothetical protein
VKLENVFKPGGQKVNRIQFKTHAVEKAWLLSTKEDIITILLNALAFWS